MLELVYMSLVSVVMPVYNAELYLSKSIESILNQSLRNFEFIIINDGSSDTSAQIIDMYAARDSRIVVVHQKNQGVTSSLNKGVALASSNYIARMDADDISKPNRLRKQVDFFSSHPEYVLVGTDYSIIDRYDNMIDKVRVAYNDQELRVLMRVNSPFAHGSVMYTKAAYEEAGGYDRIAGSAEDYDLWARFMEIGKAHILPEALFSWRLGDNNITTVKKDAVALSASKIRARLNHQPLRINKSDVEHAKGLYSRERFLHLLDAYSRICVYQAKNKNSLFFKNVQTLSSIKPEGQKIVLNRLVEIISQGKKTLYNDKKP